MIEKKVKEIIYAVSFVDVSKINNNTVLMNIIDELDFIEIIMEIELKYSIFIDEDKIETFGDLCSIIKRDTRERKFNKLKINEK